MQGQIHTELGSILIDADVVATYAGSVAPWICVMD